ncbi:MAG: UDP-N-acetylmuramoyl-tripeptide--D-alanyl-D-alanine ligase [Patescibacteria group bacterium]|nr:UDP-N-acetylmuramoyl-tripeptide--D-alanyl-D-alanine ligase [Patescibacteria group bacterium]
MNKRKTKKLIILEKILRWMAVMVLKRHKPRIVAITGSVGKTMTKEAVGLLLSRYFSVRKNEMNYNNEVGVPLTIIGANSGEGSITRWLLVFLKWIGTMINFKYPKILVLEMGSDNPGDIKYLCDFVPINVGIITSIGISHLEYFKTMQAVAGEKGILAKSVPVNGLAVLNYDNEEIRKLQQNVKANIITYGFHEEANMQATDVLYEYKNFTTMKGQPIQLVESLSFKLNCHGKIIPIKLSSGIGYPQIYSALAALSVGHYFKLNLIEASQTLKKFPQLAGRMTLLKGIKNTAIIDDTYNSVPDSVLAALETLDKIKANRKIVVLGDMLELGAKEEQAHRNIGIEVFSRDDIDFFITVGKRMVFAAEEYRRRAMKKDHSAGRIGCFNEPAEAGVFIQHILKEGDVVLVKGSQGMRMEKIVEEIMADPNEKDSLLVRQERTWKKKEYKTP